jgi:hypothetical protein
MLSALLSLREADNLTIAECNFLLTKELHKYYTDFLKYVISLDMIL